ncbi:glycerol-3-phosphate 1-O-acyltransferase PlsY [Mycoplasmopsis cricetuli]|uniref:glycerol-3-phosphate 1-O-acyltransferase PlsY n=1 Tax=Mycoplasmopsis cricetuli TaxID=171283 RepID=UPI00055D6DE8|nr:glycerol-3-phosphate 1-O-acyltransferase PlsY [Mycoplasmopsis cricetuli]
MLIFYSIIANLATFLIGYLWGSLNTSIILSKLSKNDDVRNHYSKNAGATNSFRAYGKKFALIVLIIDIGKTVLAVYLAYFLSFAWQNSNAIVYFPILAGVGTTIGHVFPVFFQFKGGKAVACSVGLLIATNIVLWPIAALIFFGSLYIKRMVSLSSLLTAAVMIVLLFIPWFVTGFLAITQGQNINHHWYLNSIITIAPLLLLIFAHRSNIKRLINKSENKI